MTAGDRPRKKGWRGLVCRCGLVADFLRDTRGNALGSVFIALICFTGTAMVSDHVVLLHQRDILQAAADSAGIAATKQMARLDPGWTRDEAAEALEPLARRYIMANLPERTRESARDTLELTLTPDMEAGVVGVEASIDFGGAIVGRHIWGRLVDRTRVASGTERVVSPVDLVLAIDVTGSMNGSIYIGDGTVVEDEDRRINVVRRAAQVLFRALYDQGGDNTGHVSVGLVPFNTTVNIGASREDWVSDLGQGHKVPPPGFSPWPGCIEHRNGELDLSLIMPGEAPFTSWFSPSTLEYRPAERAALAAQVGAEVPGENDWSADDPHERYHPSPYSGCPRDEIVPLTNDRETVEQAIADMRPWPGGGTMTHVGVVWGRRLLASAWRNAWGLPEEREELGRKKVLVVLTDGVNDAYDNKGNYPGDYRHGRRFYPGEYTSAYTGYGRAGSGSSEEGYRVGTRLDDVTDDGQERDVLNSIFLESCELAKAEGITVFTVSAVPRGHGKERELRARLVACATDDDHAFVENSEPARMEAAFRQIGRMVARVRRTRVAASGPLPGQTSEDQR